MIDKATVKRIIEAADIVEVVGDYVHLTKRGSNYMGLCPFHNEKTPSFSVSRSRNICHCFSCGKGGSPVNFLMEKEGINYHDALIRLADKYGIKVEERVLSDEERREQSERESMLVANDWAMRKMHADILESQEGKDIGLQYLYQRGITHQSILKYKLGYAIDKPRELYDSAIKLGYSKETLFAVGLCGESQQGSTPYDRFKGRIIFPVMNSAGKVVAFGGRGIRGEKAKYINSPESAIYRKSNELYGIYQAKNAMARLNKCYLVEGYLDVIGMWQSGLENVVASSGTSLTDGQIALIHRFTDNVTLIYDGDPAGIKASLRGIDLLLTHNLNIKIVRLPDGEDPHSYSIKHTPEEFQKYIEDNERDFIEFKTRTLLDISKKDPQSRSVAIRSIVTSLASISDMIKRSLYIQECSRMLDVSENILVVEVGKARGDVIANQKKQRELSRLNVQYPIDTEKPINDSSENQHLQSTSEVKIDHNPLASLEKNILSYCIKYGMVRFCNDAENGKYTTVIKFIDSEMKADSINFTIDAYKLTFHKILELSGRYKVEETNYITGLQDNYQKELNDWFESMSKEYHPADELEIKEKELLRMQELDKEIKVRDFAIRFVGDELGSDENNVVRNLVLDAITPKYQLSKYHFKSVKIESDETRLEELIPRAIYEWKYGIISDQFRKTQDMLKKAYESNDAATVENLLIKLQELSHLRSIVSKSIGERIINP